MRSPVGSHDTRRMRIKCQHGGNGTQLARYLDVATEQLFMTLVYTVEVADAYGGVLCGIRNIRQCTIDPHSAHISDNDSQAIVGQPHVLRKRPLSLLVRQVVTDMREECASGLKLLYQPDSLAHCGVRRMRFVS